ncbi:Intracellular sulfur oxidation protein DsrL [Thiorhodovibrio winogradskyi]|uniref:Intracellular sulfur oxidation protein DsrL n=1 Tax=Thiorhodovibrio winogradskyi TaxID=77007 RepID=A0ABZ0S2R5_9GAMM|nr:sulfur reduction protein DsrJ [Thiorhodovibrio winogradskyi]
MTEAKVTKPWWFAGCSTLMVLAVMGAALLGAGDVRAEAIGGFVVTGSKAAGLDSCVEPTREMRRYHMEYIRHQRDTTVYNGIRHTKYSLSGCVGCHTGHTADGVPIPVNGKGQFCNACHETAAVTLNCFDCHATVPDGEGWNQVTEQDRSVPARALHQGPAAVHPVTSRPVTTLTGVHPLVDALGATLVQIPEAVRQEDFKER